DARAKAKQQASPQAFPMAVWYAWPRHGGGSAVALMRKRHPQNAPGDWYVDTRCIDCGAARTAAPGLIVERGGQSVFARQPQTADERMMAWRARLLCPTASVRTESHRLGYNAKSAYGADSFAIRRAAGNVMVDGPRFTRAVVAQFENWGGLSDILLTHRDDVGDAER